MAGRGKKWQQQRDPRGRVGDPSRPGLAEPGQGAEMPPSPVNDAETKGEYRYGHGDSVTEVRGP